MIQHVTRMIPPSRLEACVRFYGLLGLHAVPIPDSIAGRAVWMEPAGPPAADAGTGAPIVQLHLMPAADAQPAPGHVAFVLPDYEATITLLRDAGHAVEPRAEHWGAARAYVRDPASNLVELMARAPGHRPEP
jgi:catechol 2,3-dioxygenase-like lactoylglutathione lyase family enzyme